MYEEENRRLLEAAKTKLLERARGLCRIPESELRRLIRVTRIKRRNNLGSFEPFQRQMVRNFTRIIYSYRSELYRRKTGKHWYDMSHAIMHRRDAIHIYLSDLVPHVVEEDAVRRE